MTKYIKKIYLNKELETYFILASKTKDAGHHVIDLDKNNSEIDCLILQYETLKADPVSAFKRINKFFGVELSALEFNKAFLAADRKNSNNFSNIFTSIAPGIRSTKRNGVPGEWVKEMSLEHKKIFKDNFGDLIEELGYEANDE